MFSGGVFAPLPPSEAVSLKEKDAEARRKRKNNTDHPRQARGSERSYGLRQHGFSKLKIGEPHSRHPGYRTRRARRTSMQPARLNRGLSPDSFQSRMRQFGDRLSVPGGAAKWRAAGSPAPAVIKNIFNPVKPCTQCSAFKTKNPNRTGSRSSVRLCRRGGRRTSYEISSPKYKMERQKTKAKERKQAKNGAHDKQIESQKKTLDRLFGLCYSRKAVNRQQNRA